MKPSVLLAVGGIVLVGSSIAGGLLLHKRAREATVRQALPTRPDLRAWPSELQDRIEAASETVVRGGEDAVRALGELAQLYHANGYYAEASMCYHALLDVDPGNARWPHAFGSILSGFGKTAEAAALFGRAVELAPTYMPARIRMGDALLKTNRLDDADAVFRDALRLESRQSYAHLGLGRIAFARGDWEHARGPLEQAAFLSDDRLAYDLLPTVYERLGDNARAVALRGRHKASGAFADIPDPWLDEMMLVCFDTYRLAVAAGAAKHGGDRKLAMRLLERARQLSPDSAPVHLQLGMMFFETREYTKARPHLEECTRLAPNMADGWIHLSNLLAAVGNRTESELILAGGLAHCPQSPGLMLEKGHRLASAGRNDEAIAAYRESFRLRPDEAAPLFAIAKIHFEQNRQAEAVAELTHALEAEPGFPAALSLLAFHAIASGDESSARAWLARIDLQPRVTRVERDRLALAYRTQFGRSP